jgi:hypothetical protein
MAAIEAAVVYLIVLWPGAPAPTVLPMVSMQACEMERRSLSLDYSTAGLGTAKLFAHCTASGLPLDQARRTGN